MSFYDKGDSKLFTSGFHIHVRNAQARPDKNGGWTKRDCYLIFSVTRTVKPAHPWSVNGDLNWRTCAGVV